MMNKDQHLAHSCTDSLKELSLCTAQNWAFIPFVGTGGSWVLEILEIEEIKKFLACFFVFPGPHSLGMIEVQLWDPIALIKIPILQAVWWKAYLRFTPTQPHNVADNILKCCWTLCWWHWVCLVPPPSWASATGQQQEPSPCPCVSQSPHVKEIRWLCQTLWDAVGKWDSWRALISAEPVVVIPHLLNSSPWKQLLFAFCVTPPHPL